MSVQVLLSTFQGAPYLRAQMDSLLAQDYPDVEILARDDGSSDQTLGILREFSAAHPTVSVVAGENLGYAQSFLTLLTRSSPAAAYVAFCDQDDVWQPDKISRAVGFLGSRGEASTPTLYCSRLSVVDHNLAPLRHSELPRKALSFRNALVECPMSGCTIVLNQAARQLLLRELPRRSCGHDWWAYLVVSAFGNVVQDRESRILYRKHTTNVVGIPFGAWERWGIKVRRFVKTGKLQTVVKQAEEFRRIYEPLLSAERRQVLSRFLDASRQSLWHRIRYAACCDVYRQSTLDHLVLKALIASRRL